MKALIASLLAAMSMGLAMAGLYGDASAANKDFRGYEWKVVLGRTVFVLLLLRVRMIMFISRWSLLIFASFFPYAVAAESCHETSVQAPTPYLNNGGEIIKLMDGTMWMDASYNYSYAYEYYPTVTVCPSMGFMIMEGKKIAITPVNGDVVAPRGKSVQKSTSQNVIESVIDGDFEGWEGETIFKLGNGQIWEQASYAYMYHYAYRPRVLIVRLGSGFVMQVEGVRGKINVRRLR